MKRLISLLVLLSVFSMFVIGISQDAKFKYVGVKKCKMCHKSKKSGNQFGLWSERKHSKAYATLATAQSKEVAKKAGVAGDPQKAKECLVCHVTGYGEPAEATLTLEEGVSCEACHGPGSEYKSMKVMKDIYAGKVKGADYGLLEQTNELCVKCHNPKSPTYKEFKFEEALKVIAHPVPK